MDVIGIALSVLSAMLLYASLGILAPPVFRRICTQAASLPHPIDAHERVRIIEGNREALVVRLQMIGAAKKDIVLSTFKWLDGPASDGVTAALVCAAERGVRIRIVIDDFGMNKCLKRLRAFRLLASYPNVEVKRYNCASLLLPWRYNYRLHDKYLIVDDSYYLLGGRNISDRSLGAAAKHYDIDRDVLVVNEKGTGGSLQMLEAYFEEVWSQRVSRSFRPRRVRRRKQTLEACRALLDALAHEYPQLEEAFSPSAGTLETKRVRLLHNSCRPTNKAPQVWNTLHKLAREGRDIKIQSPYIIVDWSMIKPRAHVDGAHRVQLMTNAPEQGANPFGCGEYIGHRRAIVRAGVSVLEWMGGQSMHTKTMLIDDSTSIVGSYNLDLRSTYLDTELMLVIDSTAVNEQLCAHFEQMARASRLIQGACVREPVEDGLLFEQPAVRKHFGSSARLQDLVRRAKGACKRGFARVTGVVFWPLRYLM